MDTILLTVPGHILNVELKQGGGGYIPPLKIPDVLAIIFKMAKYCFIQKVMRWGKKYQLIKFHRPYILHVPYMLNYTFI